MRLSKSKFFRGAHKWSKNNDEDDRVTALLRYCVTGLMGYWVIGLLG